MARPVIEIDDQTLSWTEFGRIMTTLAGGARIIFVPDDETHIEPKIEVHEPEQRQS